MSKNNPIKTMLKIVYFDEESVSDYLDVSAADPRELLEPVE